MMRRYKLEIRGREFEIDVNELGEDRYQVVVGEETYEVALAGDEDLPAASITPFFQPASGGGTSRPANAASVAPRPKAELVAKPAAASAPPPRRAAPAGGGGGAQLSAPMPGVILQVNVKAGDAVKRGQQVAVLEAMKMKNSIKSPRDGVVSEVCVAEGQAVGHGDAIVRFQEG
jgi:biotin carboxyl carrier protein